MLKYVSALLHQLFGLMQVHPQLIRLPVVCCPDLRHQPCERHVRVVGGGNRKRRNGYTQSIRNLEMIDMCRALEK